ncbi:unnamed protein product [Ilex paraguariensis]|uniref:Uncharacterized protein n=1 Tax=Ilex paraguariensis TaxID=185542 RepID=A0ABC8RDB7_9AQUA
MLVKALLTARDVLFEELHKLSKAINETVDLSDFTSNFDESKLFDSSLKERFETAEVPGEVSSKPQTPSEKPNGTIDFKSDEVLHSLSKGELFCSCHSLGNQNLQLWNMFLKVHRFVFTLNFL